MIRRREREFSDEGEREQKQRAWLVWSGKDLDKGPDFGEEK